MRRAGRRLHAAPGQRRRTRSTPRSTRSSTSISSATSRRSPAIIRVPNVHGGESVGSGQDRPRVHRLRQGQSGQAQHGVGRQRHLAHVAGELFKMMTGVEHAARALSRCGARADRPARPARCRCMFDTAARVDRTHQGRQAARAGGDDGDALGGSAGRPDRRRLRAGLRGERLVRRRRAARTRRPRSSTSSTRRSMPASPIPR